ncbi:bifunctional methylenetetrahydrofolate dehydrogenase/methenyltetrahydrofolate cyclohydrolase FolD [Micavibrio aeruginosavorus]|uniref:Bifunctional protein FolD n=1 Tax=Micavibrio aeruginosavorus EPB TaxID=349215 RepID=M4VGQ7_9BACT|nr:bifunctional methylenetetrahydrofolate dehydrogenase/methenyltetrahydrofolate cyclohydrolase FolD [Micavibrio aeruginosavorus]AGH98537.1 Methylenetetrahydrofolate dehydrogenase (NADP+) / Methenyltetrahydrofolate cyclohydrolase [Micavibrio aeruginosavorus EPB]
MTNKAATIIDGKMIAATMRQSIAGDVTALRARGILPGLAVILIGDDPASDIYVRNKMRACESVGIHSAEYRLPATVTQGAVDTLIDTLNADQSIHGILLQLPAPTQIDTRALINRINPAKDVDGLHPLNIGKLVSGARDAIIPCTPQGALKLIQSVRADLTGLHAVVLGRSILFGKPMAQLLLAQNCTVTTAHSKSRDLPALCAQADILIAAVGQAAMVKADWVKDGAIVIDVGINRRDDGTIVGDVDFASIMPRAAAITPVPGGVGPMTIACLLANTVAAAQQTTP